MTEPLSLHYATSSTQYMTPHYQGHPLLSSRVSPFRATTTLTDREYKDLIKTTRYYYRVDPIASVVIDRLAEIAATEIRIKPQPLQGDGDVSDDVLALYRAVAGILQQAMIPIITSYLVDGMAAPQYELVRLMGNRVSGALGRTRYFVPSRIWVRDTLQIELQPNVLGGEPLAFVRVPASDVQFIMSNGVYPNGVKDEKTFRLLLEQYPDYVKKIKAGETLFPLTTPVIYRNLVSSFLYPKPYLEPALEPLQRKHLLHRLDRSLVQRTIETFRHIKAGSDKYPATADDIEALKTVLQQNSDETLFNLFTNHAVSIEWVVPPFEKLFGDEKYQGVIREILFALGFPRILIVGETERSNSADNQVAMLGIFSTIKHIQRDVLQWVYHVFRHVAEENGIVTIPTPYFAPPSIADATQLLQYAQSMIEAGVISKDTAAKLYGTDYEYERAQRLYEQQAEPPMPIRDQEPV